MGEWFSKVISALAGQTDPRQNTKRALQAAHRARVRVALEVPSAGQTVVVTSTIEQVRDDDFIVSQPTVGGLTHPLAFGEAINISFVNQSLYHTGQTRCLGRIKVPAGQGDNVLFAYRLAMPDELRVDDRRKQPRVTITLSAMPQAQLYSLLSGEKPHAGYIHDISMTGARILLPQPPQRLMPGDALFLKAALPEPVGLIDDLVDICRIDIDPRTSQCAVGVKFRKRIEGLDVLIRNEQAASKASQRQRVA
jgi:c-di-GMP-binding flagellar brake protein YcgR